MAQKDNIKLVENTGGQLKYLQSKIIKVNSNGIDIDFADTEFFEFENGRLKCNHLDIFNNGPNKCMIGFDTTARSDDFLGVPNFSFTIYSGKPFNFISLDGEADSMSLRTLSDETATIEIIVW
jgi:predicted ester cyclase